MYTPAKRLLFAVQLIRCPGRARHRSRCNREQFFPIILVVVVVVVMDATAPPHLATPPRPEDTDAHLPAKPRKRHAHGRTPLVRAHKRRKHHGHRTVVSETDSDEVARDRDRNRRSVSVSSSRSISSSSSSSSSDSSQSSRRIEHHGRSGAKVTGDSRVNLRRALANQTQMAAQWRRAVLLHTQIVTTSCTMLPDLCASVRESVLAAHPGTVFENWHDFVPATHLVLLDDATERRAVQTILALCTAAARSLKTVTTHLQTCLAKVAQHHARLADLGEAHIPSNLSRKSIGVLYATTAAPSSPPQ